jgi:pyroglutamyl-peptidase
VDSLLLTGFEPFGGDSRNPSGEIAAALDGTVLHGRILIHSLVLPVATHAAWQLTVTAVRRTKPRWIVATGVAPRATINPESQAVNWCDYRIPDNSGIVRRDQPSVPGTRRIYRTGVDTNKLAAAIRAAGIPAEPSDDAGRFVCNDFYTHLLRLTSRPTHRASRRSLFVHVPKIPEMGGNPPFLPLADIHRGLVALLTALTVPHD